jgi:hypothetical protein
MRPQDLVGKDILVGLTYLDTEGRVLRQEQFHGRIEEANKDSIRVRTSDGGRRRWVPNDPAAIRPAPGGSYRLASTGQVVTDPTLLTSWKITVLPDDDGKTYGDAEPNYAPLVHSRVPEEWDLAHVIDEARIRRTIEEFGDEYIGRTLLLGVTYTGPEGELRCQEQYVGTIMVVDFERGIVVSCEPDGHPFVLPGDPSWVQKAPPGVYRLRSTGQVVTNPDYIAKVTIEQPD